VKGGFVSLAGGGEPPSASEELPPPQAARASHRARGTPSLPRARAPVTEGADGSAAQPPKGGIRVPSSRRKSSAVARTSRRQYSPMSSMRPSR
jgi:hypothetical protein